jgi:hypothetical protein
VFTSGARLALTSNQRGVWQLLNPAGSGILVHVVAMDVYTDEPTRVRWNRHDTPLAATPVEPFALNQANPAVPDAELRVLNNGTTNAPGTALPIEARATAHAPYRFAGHIVIPPGYGYLAWVQAPSGLTAAADVAAAATWYGTPIP